MKTKIKERYNIVKVFIALSKYYKRGNRYLVIVRKPFADYEVGDIISTHKNKRSAVKEVGDSSVLDIIKISDLLGGY